MYALSFDVSGVIVFLVVMGPLFVNYSPLSAYSSVPPPLSPMERHVFIFLGWAVSIRPGDLSGFYVGSSRCIFSFVSGTWGCLFHCFLGR